jgi:endoglucanase
MLNILKSLCECDGVSAREDKIAELICELLRTRCDELYRDKCGNLIAKINGKSDEKRIVYTSRMDMQGCIVSHIEDSGKIRFFPLGSFNALSMLYSRVIFSNGQTGIILPDSKDKKEFKAEDLYVDAGYTSRACEGGVSVGDTFTYERKFSVLGDSKICSPALDGRIGCALLVRAILEMEAPQYDSYFVFTAQSRVGARGAKTAVKNIDPDIIVELDASHTEKEDNTLLPKVESGKGPAILLTNRALVSCECLVSKAEAIAKENGIPLQKEFSRAGGSDAAAMQACGRGAKTLTLTIPVNNSDTSIECADKTDIEHAYTLLSELIKTNLCKDIGE